MVILQGHIFLNIEMNHWADRSHSCAFYQLVVSCLVLIEGWDTGENAHKMIPCPDCGKIFSRRYNMTRHRNLTHATGDHDDQDQKPVVEVDLQEAHNDTDEGSSSYGQTSTDDESEYETKYTTIWKYIKEHAWTPELQDMFRTKKVALLEEGVPAGEAHQTACRHVSPTLRRNIRRVYADKIPINQKLRRDVTRCYWYFDRQWTE